MRAHIVCYEDPQLWITGKIARKLTEELVKLGVEATLGGGPDPSAEINHHIIYLAYEGHETKCDTVLITHVDSLHKMRVLKRSLSRSMGICFSSQTVRDLVTAGVPQERLCYISPGHDGIIKAKPVVIGITSKLFDDGRKLEGTLLGLCKQVAPADIAFQIMGEGWGEIVQGLRTQGFQIDYHPTFDYKLYTELMPTLDYYLYMGKDEGSMGFMDALSAGIPTIVTPQGFHLDVPNGITHPFSNLGELTSIVTEIAQARSRRVDSVKAWTWTEYAKKHLMVWEYLLSEQKQAYLKDHPVSYPDGLASVALGAVPEKANSFGWLSARLKLLKGSIRALVSRKRKSLHRRD